MPRCARRAAVPQEVRRAAELLERRWLLSILYAALAGAIRFGEFREAVEGIPPRTLAERLRELERAGVVERRVVPASPPFAEYTLTAEGRALAPVLEAVRCWTVERAQPAARQPA